MAYAGREEGSEAGVEIDDVDHLGGQRDLLMGVGLGRGLELGLGLGLGLGSGSGSGLGLPALDELPGDGVDEADVR